jgi:hypothetical protein
VRRLSLAGLLVLLLWSPLSDEHRREPRLFSAEPASQRGADALPIDGVAAVLYLSDRAPDLDLSSRHARAVALQGMSWPRDVFGHRKASWAGRSGDPVTTLAGLPPGSAAGQVPGDMDWSSGGGSLSGGAAGFGGGQGGGGGGVSGGSWSGGIVGVGGGGGAAGSGSPGASGSPAGSSPSGPGGSLSVAGDIGGPPLTAVPEPATLFLLGSGLAGLSALRWKRRRR